jgi:hypothetical protein
MAAQLAQRLLDGAGGHVAGDGGLDDERAGARRNAKPLRTP